MAAAAGALIYGMSRAVAPIAHNIKNLVVEYLSPTSDIIVISHLQPHARTIAPKNPVFLIVSAISGYFTSPPPPSRQVVVTRILQIVRQPPTTTSSTAFDNVEFGYGLHIILFGIVFTIALLYSLYARSQVATYCAAVSKDLTAALNHTIEKQQRQKKRLEDRLVDLQEEVARQKSDVLRLLITRLRDVASLEASKTDVEDKLRKVERDSVCQLQLANAIFCGAMESHKNDMAALVAQGNADALRAEKELETSTHTRKKLEEKVLSVEQEAKLQLLLAENTLREELDGPYGTAFLISQHRADALQREKELESATQSQKTMEAKVLSLEKESRIQLLLAEHTLREEFDGQYETALLISQHQAHALRWEKELEASTQARKALEAKVLSVETESKQQLQLTERTLREEIDGPYGTAFLISQHEADMQSLEDEAKISTQALDLSEDLKAKLLSVQQEVQAELKRADKELADFKATAAEAENILRAEREALSEERDQLTAQVADLNTTTSAQGDTIVAQQAQIEELSSEFADEDTSRSYRTRGGRTRNRGLHRKISALEEENEGLRGEMEALRKEIKGLKGEDSDDGAEAAEEGKSEGDNVKENNGAEDAEQDASDEANAATEGFKAAEQASEDMSLDVETPGQQSSIAPSPSTTPYSPPTGPRMSYVRDRRPPGGPQPRAGRLAAEPFVLPLALQGEESSPAAAEAAVTRTEPSLSPSPSPSVVLPAGSRHQYPDPRPAARQPEIWRPEVSSSTPATTPSPSPIPPTTPTGPRYPANCGQLSRGRLHYQQQQRQPQQQRRNGLYSSLFADPDFDLAQSKTEYKPF